MTRDALPETPPEAPAASPESAAPTSTPSPWQGRRRKALIVGIDRYACPCLHDLGGCRNDALRLGTVLAEAFDVGVVRLLDEEATRAAVIEHLAALLTGSRRDEEIVFCFSGHGSRILSHDYGAFETLVPHDSFRPDKQGRRRAPNRDITDRELYGWILKVSERGARVTLIIDACRSGGIVRELEVQPRGVEPDLRRGTLEDKVAFLQTGDGEAEGRAGHDLDEKHRAPSRRITPGGWLPPSDRYTLLAACQAEQFCRETIDADTGRQHGILSLYVARELPRLRQATSWRELRDRIARPITAENPGQDVQLEGALDRQVLGGAWLRPEPFAPVLGSDRSGVDLGRGAAHGVQRSSTWGLFPASARRPAGRALAAVSVERVGATRSWARFEKSEDESPQRPRREDPPELAGCRAFEVARPLDSKLRLLVARRHRALEQAVAASPLLELTAESVAADLVIHQLGPRRDEARHEPAPLLFPLDAPHWVIVDRDGVQVMPARPVPPASLPALSVERTVERTVADLERIARHRFLHALAHPEPRSSLAPLVDVQMLRKRAKGPWSRIDPGSPVPLGDQIALHLERRAGAPEKLHVAALDLGLTGAVTQIYPRRAQRLLWTRGRLEIGRRADDTMCLGLPPGYPFVGEPPFKSARETVLVFLSTRPADFDGLTQGAVGIVRSRTAETGSSPLAAILDRGLGLALRSNGGENLLEDTDQWGLLACPFEVVA